jgi:hypothetical protein
MYKNPYLYIDCLTGQFDWRHRIVPPGGRVTDMKRCGASILALATLLFLFSAAAHADLIYDNGAVAADNFAGGAAMQGFFRFEDFTLTGPAQIDQVRFWIWEYEAGPPLDSYYWEIQADSGGLPGYPGSPIASGTVAQSDVTRTLAFVSGEHQVYENLFSLGSVDLGSGTYWFGLHLGPPEEGVEAISYDFLWAFQLYDPSRAGFMSYDLRPDATGWSPFGNELGLQLYGATVVPEPATALLLGVALVGLAGLRKRKPL